MVLQTWLNNDSWEKLDPKLRQLEQAPCVLPHTGRLADSIDSNPPGIVIVRGPRQAGKSTFLRQFVQKVFKAGYPPKSVGLLEAENLISRHELLGEIQQFCSAHRDGSLLLIDEITSIDSWWLALKLAADEGVLENALVLCTGSSAIELSTHADLLPGRRGRRFPVDFELLPVRYKDVAREISVDEFLLTGGFPWSLNEYMRDRYIPPFVYEVYRSWIQGCFVRSNHTVRNLGPLLAYLARRTGTPMSVTNLARDCGIGANSTAETYIGVLERNYVLMQSHWSSPGTGVGAPRKNRKLYPADPLLFHLLCDYEKSSNSAFELAKNRLADESAIGAMVETLVASELRHCPGMYPLFYFLGNKEIDFMGKEAVEVKYQRHVSINEFTWTRKVLPPKMTFTVVTRQTAAIDGNIRLVPLKEWLLEDR